MPENTRGMLRRSNPASRVRTAHARARKRGDYASARALRKQQRSLPSRDPLDPGYRRLRYVRYADDILLGFAGPKAEPRRSNVASLSSCAMGSSWSCPRPRR